jgi:quercetin dioxygenase-like cupin family protein
MVHGIDERAEALQAMRIPLWSNAQVTAARRPTLAVALDELHHRRATTPTAGVQRLNQQGEPMSNQDLNEKAKNTQSVLQSVTPTFMPTDAEVMTLRIDYPPGDPGIPPHRHLGGPCFGYVLEGEMVFELEGEPPRVIKAGEAFWEPGGDVIHYQDANNRTDSPLRFLVTMMMAPNQQVLVFVDDDELKQSGWVKRSPEE